MCENDAGCSSSVSFSAGAGTVPNEPDCVAIPANGRLGYGALLGQKEGPVVEVGGKGPGGLILALPAAFRSGILELVDVVCSLPLAGLPYVLPYQSEVV